jgi:glycosyltransferase involved in cell wall biosynthesis
MIEAVEAAGHQCVIYLYDRFNGLHARHKDVIRKYWPNVQAEVCSVRDGLEPLDAYVASGWQTAHVLAARASLPTRRLYLVQDFEPYFYPLGTEYVLAEDTYRFGFRPIVVGWFVAELLEKSFGISAEVADHGCDTTVYKLTNPGERSGVAFYAKPRVPRRGFDIGMLGLREFHRRMPGQEIHIFGDAHARMPFPVINHGSMRPALLSELYNKCRAGLAMSFTNVSLVPAEMLACGTVAVMSGTGYTRADLDNPFLRLAEPSPSAIADQLCAAFEQPISPSEIAVSIKGGSWAPAQTVTLKIIEDEVYGPTAQ